MPTLYLTTPGTRASLAGQHLEIDIPATEDEGGDVRDLADACGPTRRRVPLHDVEHVVVATSATLTIAAQAALAENEIPVVIVRANGSAVAHCLPPATDPLTRLAHYQRRLDPAFGLEVSRTLVEAKIANSRRLLQRLAANRNLPPPNAVARLEPFRAGALRAPDLDTLRGYEGSAAGAYFPALADFFPPQAPFERRSRRPPHNASNALLSFAYSLLVHETATALHLRGLDPALGFLHEPEPHRPALALDLIEPFRAPLADGLALDLLNHGTLHPDRHFKPADGGIYLNLSGRRRFFTAYERRMDRPFTSELSGQRTTLRQEIHRQVLDLKRHLHEATGFQPFIMN
jgi:CRISPR-associated protein Cas1